VEQEKLQAILDLGPSGNDRIPLKAGHWVKIYTQIEDGLKDQSLSTFKVIKIVGNIITMEVETTIRKIIIKQGHKPARELQEEYMAMAQDILKELFSSGYRIGDSRMEASSEKSKNQIVNFGLTGAKSSQ
jgi:hypothetical protein